MNKGLKKCFALALVFSLLLQGNSTLAHSGRTDSNGGHHDYRNASGLGSYHYHHGYGPHLHENGACPYSSSSSSTSSSSGNSADRAHKCDKTIQKYQKRLNKLGFSCGSADGRCGAQTKRAIRRFQKKHRLSVTGNLNSRTKKKIDQAYSKK